MDIKITLRRYGQMSTLAYSAQVSESNQALSENHVAFEFTLV